MPVTAAAYPGPDSINSTECYFTLESSSAFDQLKVGRFWSYMELIVCLFYVNYVCHTLVHIDLNRFKQVTYSYHLNRY